MFGEKNQMDCLNSAEIYQNIKMTINGDEKNATNQPGHRAQ